mmetsp:Transcript_35603/g.111387  ORF Transcript_35603/g.111387 Transcript_35603/m.111387 type:complete len:200 (-) Transcript_35603:344-943(-)
MLAQGIDLEQHVLSHLQIVVHHLALVYKHLLPVPVQEAVLALRYPFLDHRTVGDEPLVNGLEGGDLPTLVEGVLTLSHVPEGLDRDLVRRRSIRVMGGPLLLSRLRLHLHRVLKYPGGQGGVRALAGARREARLVILVADVFDVARALSAEGSKGVPLLRVNPLQPSCSQRVVYQEGGGGGDASLRVKGCQLLVLAGRR